tara:strand:+ start:5095 stop:5742 length:648 start_codon:yes stop_codon:yes gene_type:complete
MIIPKISTKNKEFSLAPGVNEDHLMTTHLSVIVVGANPNLSKKWIKGEYSEDNLSPSCFSFDGKIPDESSVEPQADMCALCPQNAWGSRTTPTGKRIKACADYKRLAVVLAEKPTDEVYLLQVTPTSLKNLNAYHKILQSKSISPEIAKTRVSFDTTVEFPRLVFEFAGFVDESLQDGIDKLCVSEDVKIITGELSASERQPTFSDYGFTKIDKS